VSGVVLVVFACCVLYYTRQDNYELYCVLGTVVSVSNSNSNIVTVRVKEKER